MPAPDPRLDPRGDRDLRAPMGAPMNAPMNNPMVASMVAPMGASMGGSMAGSMGGSMGGSIGTPMGGSMGAPMGGPMGGAMGDRDMRQPLEDQDLRTGSDPRFRGGAPFDPRSRPFGQAAPQAPLGRDDPRMGQAARPPFDACRYCSCQISRLRCCLQTSGRALWSSRNRLHAAHSSKRVNKHPCSHGSSTFLSASR